jgi:hypothetical protein
VGVADRTPLLLLRYVASIRMSTERRRCRRTIAVIRQMVMDTVGEQGLSPAGPLFTSFHRLVRGRDNVSGIEKELKKNPM